MFNTIVGARAIAAWRYGSGSCSDRLAVQYMIIFML
jgi:hypothetical protein